MFKKFFIFLLPAFRIGIIEALISILNNHTDRPVRRPYSRDRIDYTTYRRSTYAPKSEKKYASDHGPFRRTEGFHDVLLVAFDLKGVSAKDVHEWLQSQMPACGDYDNDGNNVSLDSWWVANDQRFDGSDTDSAVFVPKGLQSPARLLLREKSFFQ